MTHITGEPCEYLSVSISIIRNVYIDLISNYLNFIKISVEIQKEPLLDEKGQPKLDEFGKPAFYSGFSIGGGIDQDHRLSPQKYPDNVKTKKI